MQKENNEQLGKEKKGENPLVLPDPGKLGGNSPLLSHIFPALKGEPIKTEKPTTESGFISIGERLRDFTKSYLSKVGGHHSDVFSDAKQIGSSDPNAAGGDKDMEGIGKDFENKIPYAKSATGEGEIIFSNLLDKDSNIEEQTMDLIKNYIAHFGSSDDIKIAKNFELMDFIYNLSEKHREFFHNIFTQKIRTIAINQVKDSDSPIGLANLEALEKLVNETLDVATVREDLSLSMPLKNTLNLINANRLSLQKIQETKKAERAKFISNFENIYRRDIKNFGLKKTLNMEYREYVEAGGHYLSEELLEDFYESMINSDFQLLLSSGGNEEDIMAFKNKINRAARKTKFVSTSKYLSQVYDNFNEYLEAHSEKAGINLKKRHASADGYVPVTKLVTEEQAIEPEKPGLFARIKGFLGDTIKNTQNRIKNASNFSGMQESVREMRKEKKNKAKVGLMERVSSLFSPLKKKTKQFIMGLALLGTAANSAAVNQTEKMPENNNELKGETTVSSGVLADEKVEASNDERKNKEFLKTFEDEKGHVFVALEDEKTQPLENDSENILLENSLAPEDIVKGDSTSKLSKMAREKYKSLIESYTEQYPELAEKDNKDWAAALALANDAKAIELGFDDVEMFTNDVENISKRAKHLMNNQEIVELAIDILLDKVSVNSEAYKLMQKLTKSDIPDSEDLRNALF